MMFRDLNEDAYTPMRISAMIELSDCRRMCGGSVEEEIGEGEKSNKNTCIAIAGIPINGTIAIKKYCIPRALGESVFSAQDETWYVWYSEEWTDTALDIKFTDTKFGDTIVVLRDNKGKSLSTGPKQQFISLHARAMQQDSSFYTLQYGTSEDRINRQMLVSSSQPISGMPPATEILAITDFYIVPKDETDRQPWIWVDFIVYDGSNAGDITRSQKVQGCMPIDVLYFIVNRGQIPQPGLRKCNLNGFFETNRGSRYIPVAFPSNSIDFMHIVQIPTDSGAQLCMLSVAFETIYAQGGVERRCFDTPEEFTSNTKFPTRMSWAELSRSMLLGSNVESFGTSVTQQGVAVSQERQLSQNTLSPPFTGEQASTRFNVFSSNDPDSRTHWLTQLRIFVEVSPRLDTVSKT